MDLSVGPWKHLLHGLLSSPLVIRYQGGSRKYPSHTHVHTRTHMWKTLNRLSAQHQRDGFAVMQRTSRSLLLSWLCINTPLIVYTVLQGFGFQGPSLWAGVRSPHTQAHTELQKYGRTCGCAHIHANANQTPRVPAFVERRNDGGEAAQSWSPAKWTSGACLESFQSESHFLAGTLRVLLSPLKRAGAAKINNG